MGSVAEIEQFSWMEGTAQQDLKVDPRLPFAKDSGWLFADQRGHTDGRNCQAMFVSSKGAIVIAGPRAARGLPALGFFGRDIPDGRNVGHFVPITLEQTGQKTVQLQAALLASQNGLGGLAIVVQSIDPVLAMMLDKIDFKIRMNGKLVFAMGWQNGLAARNILNQCVHP